MTFKGKGYFIWKITNCEEGNAEAIARTARAAGLSHVLIKVANGNYKYNYDWRRKIDMVPPVVEALKKAGIAVWGWHYVYGKDPLAEASIAIQRVKNLGLEGYVVNAEAEYKQPQKGAAATAFMKRLRAGLPNTPLALSSYRYPSYHPTLPWKEFLTHCDYVMPQVYWMQAHNPGAQLKRTVREFAGMTPMRPVIPTGATFSEHQWTPTAPEVLEFLQTAQQLNLSAVNFWSWDAARPSLPELWKVVQDFPWEGAPPPVPDISEQLIRALNTHDVDKVLALYDEKAVLVQPGGTLQGKDKLRVRYELFFKEGLPNATFTLTGYSGKGASRHLTWEASTPGGTIVRNGNDTLGLKDGKIFYHTTYYSLG